MANMFLSSSSPGFTGSISSQMNRMFDYCSAVEEKGDAFVSGFMQVLNNLDLSNTVDPISSPSSFSELFSSGCFISGEAAQFASLTSTIANINDLTVTSAAGDAFCNIKARSAAEAGQHEQQVDGHTIAVIATTGDYLISSPTDLQQVIFFMLDGFPTINTQVRNSFGVSFSDIFTLVKDQVDNSTLFMIAKHVLEGLLRTSKESISDLYNWILATCGSVSSKMVEFVSAITQSMSGGAAAILNTIKSLFSMVSSTSAQNDRLVQTSNAVFSVTNALAGILRGVFSTVASIALAIVAGVSGIVGGICRTLQFVTRPIADILAQTPLEHWQYSSSESQDYLPYVWYSKRTTIPESFKAYFDKSSVLRAPFPGGVVVYMYDSQATTNNLLIEVHPSLSYTETMALRLTYGSYFHEDSRGLNYSGWYGIGSGITLTNDFLAVCESDCDETFSRLNVFDEAVLAQHTTEEIDNECLRRLVCAWAHFVAFMFLSAPANQGEMYHFSIFGIEDWSNTIDTFLTAMQTAISRNYEDTEFFGQVAYNIGDIAPSPTDVEQPFDWVLYDRPVVARIRNLFITPTVGAPFTLNNVINPMDWIDVTEYRERSGVILNWGDYVWMPPRLGRGNTLWTVFVCITGTLLLAGALTATAVGIKRSLTAGNARRSAAVESAWSEYVANPTTANRQAYQKSVRRNNFWATFTGGSKYSKASYWEQVSSNGYSVIPAITDSIGSSEDSTDAKLDDIKLLIAG
jgi:hypothetical protein